MSSDQKFPKRPLYLQVRDLVLERITSGVWKPGDMLPAEVDLARGARHRLRHRPQGPGRVGGGARRLAPPGEGTFVNDSKMQELAGRHDNPLSKDGRRIGRSPSTSEIGSGPASEAERQRLGLADGERVVRIRRVHTDGEGPYMYEEVALPERHFPGLAERTRVPERIADLAREFGLVLGRGVETVSAAPARAAVAEALSIARGAPILELDRVVFASDGHPVEWRVAACHLRDESHVVEFD